MNVTQYSDLNTTKLVLKKSDNMPGTDFSLSLTINKKALVPEQAQLLVGCPGVGASSLLADIQRSMTSFKKSKKELDPIFTRVISMSFDPFTRFSTRNELNSDSTHTEFAFIGHLKDDQRGAPLTFPMVLWDMQEACIANLRSIMSYPAGRDALETITPILEKDVFFADVIAARHDSPEMFNTIHSELGSSHTRTLYAILSLIRLMTPDNKNLILIDEPESYFKGNLSHLFFLSLRELLRNTDNLAILATQSPHIIQEVPKTCITQLFRAGKSTDTSHPDMETYGSSINEINTEILRKQIMETDFYQVLKKEVDLGLNRKDILNKLNNQVGFTGRSLLATLIANHQIDMAGASERSDDAPALAP